MWAYARTRGAGPFGAHQLGSLFGQMSLGRGLFGLIDFGLRLFGLTFWRLMADFLGSGCGAEDGLISGPLQHCLKPWAVCAFLETEG